MSTTTTNYNLIKPDLTDPADITATNPNWDKIDEELAKKAELDPSGKVPADQLPSMDYVPNSEKGKASGVATLGSDGKVPTEQLPQMDYAPDGFGLGETAVAIDSWNNAKANGYYYSNVDAPNASTWYGHVVVSSGNDILVQTVYANSNGVIHRCVRRRVGGSFGDWEWDNPPLSGGLEYRTTERLEGKAVYKRAYEGGAIEYRLDGETTWKKYANAVGAAQATHYHDASDVGAVNKNGDTMYGSLTVNGAITVQRGETDRKARTVVYDNAEDEIDIQNYGSDTNYVGLRLASEATGAGDVVKVAHMKNGEFASYTVLHTGNKEKIFTYGTSDLTAGSSALGTGMLYFVYE